MRWFMALFGLLLCWPAYADVCVSPDALKAAMEMNPGSGFLEEINGSEATEFVRLFNAEPPVSDAKADQILSFAQARQPYVPVAFFSNGCVQKEKGGLHIERYLEMREKAKGQAS